MKYNYTDDQRNAITTDQSCVLVLGSAGTGKTHVLVERMNYLVGTLGVKQGQILLITSSYNELYNIESKMDEIIDGSSICMYTVQMLALKVILDHEGYDKVFLDADSLKALKDKITRSSFETEKQYNEYLSMPRVYPNQTSKINEMYNQYIKTHNIMHQTDYIDYAIKLIESNDAIKVKYVNLYSHVLIDNAQDYDGLQSKLISLLTNNTQSFFVLGNDDQLLKPVDIETTYLYEVHKQDNFKQIILKDNYKTAKSIIKLATLIKANKPRLNPDINYMIDDPYRPKYMLCHDGVEIQKQMITEIKQLLNTEDDLKLSDICIITSKEHKDLWINYLKQFDYTMDEIKMDVHIDEGIFNALAKHILEPIDKDNLFTFMLDLIKQIDITKIAENQMIELTSIYLGVSKTVNIENFILFLHLKVYQHIQYNNLHHIQVLTINETKGLEFKNVFIPSILDLVNDDPTHSRRIMYNALFTAKDFVYLYDLETSNHPILDEIQSIVENWNSVQVKKSIYKDIIASKDKSYLSVETLHMFKAVVGKYQGYPKLLSELTYLMDVIKNFDQILGEPTEPTNIDIYMQAFRYFIQHTLKVTMDVAFESKRTKIAAYFQGGSAGNFSMDKDYKHLINSNLLDKSFSLNEFKGIHDIYRYLSATHHKNDHNRLLSDKDIKQAKKNIDIFRKFSNRDKIKYYVSVIKLYHAIDLNQKQIGTIEAAIE